MIQAAPTTQKGRTNLEKKINYPKQKDEKPQIKCKLRTKNPGGTAEDNLPPLGRHYTNRDLKLLLLSTWRQTTLLEKKQKSRDWRVRLWSEKTEIKTKDYGEIDFLDSVVGEEDFSLGAVEFWRPEKVDED